MVLVCGFLNCVVFSPFADAWLVDLWAEAKGCFGKATEPQAKASGGVVPKQKSQVSQSYSPQNPYPYLLSFLFHHIYFLAIVIYKLKK